MPDIILSAFATSPRKQIQNAVVDGPLPPGHGQPVDLFRDQPTVVSLAGIGADTFMATFDTQRGPREPWGGKPFAREAQRYAQIGDGSIIEGCLRTHARGVRPDRIALVAFSAGGTFVKAVLQNEKDRDNVDTVVLLDALHVNKFPGGKFIPQDLEPWVRFAAKAVEVGERARGQGYKEGSADPALFRGPMFVTAHTQIKQSAALEAQVGNTTDSSRAVFNAAVDRVAEAGGAPRTISFDESKLFAGPPPPAVTIRGGNPPTSKTYARAPLLGWTGFGNCFDLQYSGTSGPDHIYAAYYAQPAIWSALMAPRWNVGPMIASVAGLGALGTMRRAGRGLGGFVDYWGNIVPAGTYHTGVPLWQMGVAGVLGAAAGYALVSSA